VPYGGGTSVVGGVEALSDGHSAVVSLELSGLRSVELDGESLTARGGGPRPPAPAGGGGGGGARSPRRDARALPAVLRGGDHRGLRRDAFRRPGLERLRALRRARHGPRAHLPGGEASHPPGSAHRRGTVAA
jgi:hypothetical protein